MQMPRPSSNVPPFVRALGLLLLALLLMFLGRFFVIIAVLILVAWAVKLLVSYFRRP
jgi:hypothetical protein